MIIKTWIEIKMTMKQWLKREPENINCVVISKDELKKVIANLEILNISLQNKLEESNC